MRKRTLHRCIELFERLQLTLQTTDDFLSIISRRTFAIARLSEKRLIGLLEIHDKSLLVRLGIMDQATQVSQATLAQASEDHIDGGPLFTHEQHSHVSRNIVRNQVCDRLGFACARWALNDIARTNSSHFDRGRLSGIRRHDVKAILQRQTRRQWTIRRAGSQGEYRVKRWVSRGRFQQGFVVPH